jgi:hypothetical protein
MSGPWGAIRPTMRKASQSSTLSSLRMNWLGVLCLYLGQLRPQLGFQHPWALHHFSHSLQPTTRDGRICRKPCFLHLEGASSTHQGMRRPRRVQGDLLMQKPTRGSVKASQARPTNRMMEAEKGFTCNEEEAKFSFWILPLTSVPTSRQRQPGP